jgi:hypothetical protein
LIFFLLGLDLNQVLYLGILLGIDPLDLLHQLGLTLFIWLGFNFISLLNQSCINLMFPCTKRSLTRSKEGSSSCTFFVLPDHLTRVFTRSGNSLPDFLPGHIPGFFPEIVPDSLPESLPETLFELLPESYPSVLPGALPESYPNTYPIRLTRPYPSIYTAG